MSSKVSGINAFQILFDRAAVRVDISDPKRPFLLPGEDIKLKKHKNIALIALLDCSRRKLRYELGFGRPSPYTHVDNKNHRFPARIHEPIPVTDEMWEYLTWILSVMVWEKFNGEKKGWVPNKKGAATGRRFWNERGTLVVYETRTPFLYGMRLTISTADKELLARFLEGEPKGEQWMDRLRWIVNTTNALMRHSTPNRIRGTGTLEELLSNGKNRHHLNRAFTRPNILLAYLPQLDHKEFFLDFLKERRFIAISEWEQLMDFIRSLPKKTKILGSNKKNLNFVMRGNRKNGHYTFEILQEGNDIPMPKFN